jgi:type IV fimbrial biogenesis protein FimT
MQMSRTLEHGFTLGELLIALAVVGISLTIAVPGFNDMVNNNRRRAAVNEFVSTLHIARSEAITRNQRITVCPTAGGATCEAVAWSQGWLTFVDLNSDQSVNPGELVVSHVEEQSRMNINSAQFGAFLMFRPNGRMMVANAAQNTGEATFCDPRGAQHARVVIISSSGLPRLSKTTTAGGAPACP